MLNAKCLNNYNNYREMKRNYRLDNIYRNNNNNISLTLFIKVFNKAY